MWTPMELSINQIEVDLNLQMRANEPPPEEYAELLKKNRGKWPFPPIRVVKVGDRLLLVEGFTRLRAAVQAGRSKIEVEAREGTWASAVEEACGSNAEHGYRRTAADKRRAIVRAYEELTQSPSKIATICRVSRTSVYAVLEELRPAKAPRAASTATQVQPSAVIAPPPSRPAVASEIDEECPVCGACNWTPTDAGYVCDVCRYEHGEVAAVEEEDREDRASRRELIEDGVKRDLAAVNSDFGRLVRSLQRAGLAEVTERHMLQINKKIQDAIRAQRRGQAVG